MTTEPCGDLEEVNRLAALVVELRDAAEGLAASLEQFRPGLSCFILF